MSLLGREYLSASFSSAGRRPGTTGERQGTTSVGPSEPCYLLTQGSDDAGTLAPDAPAVGDDRLVLQARIDHHG